MGLLSAWRLALALLVLSTAAPALAVVGASQPGSPLAASLVMVLNRDGAVAGFCTGVVLTPRVVLTAAHCVPPGAGVRIHFAEAGAAPVLLPVDAVVRHPDYHADAIRTRQRSVDLALIHLSAPLPSRFVPATLAEGSGARPGARFTLSGFGLGREGVPTSSGQLRSTGLAARMPLSDLLLWLDDPAHKGAGACTGDSGAPIVEDGATSVAALAVWSAGQGRQHCGALTQALWLAPQRVWIESVLLRWNAAR